MSRSKAKRSFDEYKEIDKYISTGKISNAIRILTEEAKSDVLSLIDKFNMKTDLDVLREKHPKPSKANLNYILSNKHPKISSYQQFIFEELNASMVIKSAMGVLALPVLMPTNAAGF